MLKKVGALLVVVCITWALIEVGLHLLGFGDPILYKVDGPYVYRLAPNQKKRMIGPEVEINSMGLRGPELNPEKAKIVFFGDSITYGGNGLTNQATFVQQLNRSQLIDGHEALNAGVNGYGAQNIKELFRFYQGRINFDKTVLVIPSIDFDRPLKKSGFFEIYKEDDSFYGRSHMFLKMVFLELRYLLQRLRQENPVPATNGVSANDDTVTKNIRSYQYVINNSPKTVVFIVPSRGENSGEIPVSRHKEVFLAQLDNKSGDALIVDMYDLMRTYGTTIFRDEVHFNEQGHSVMAELMLHHLNRHFASAP